ncbi:MAG TPA: 30S ribosomal protein S20 [Patescibacteria group bacterium]|nr:30S ribosomal protein S20 [Patescibacteria group bacterium]
MPVTKTARRALRGSKRKGQINSLVLSRLEIAVRKARTSKTKELILKAISLSDRASKKKVIHKNKAARIKSSLAKLLPKRTSSKSKKTGRKVSKK